MNKKIVLYGAGEQGRKLIDILQFCNIEIATIVDSNAEKWGTCLGGYRIESPNVLHHIEDYILCITIQSDSVKKSIIHNLIDNYGFEKKNEISYMDLILYAYNQVEVKQFDIQRNGNFPKRLSVIFDCEHGLGLGGIEEWTKGICSKFVEEDDYDAFILTNYGEYEIPGDLTKNIIRVDVRLEDAYSPSNICKLMKGIVPFLPCILVTSQPNEVLVVGKILKKYYGKSIRVVSGIRGGSEYIYDSYWQKRECTDLFVCVSSDITNNMIRRGIPKDKVFTMICPMEYPDALDRKYNIERNQPIRLGYAGRIVVPQKRMDLLLQVISELERRQVNYYLELAGEGDFEKQIEEYIAQNGIDYKVKLVGKLGKKELYKFWQNKDICLNIADYEGRSRSVAEAMANGAVPIVTATSGVNDDIRNDENGFIVPIGNYSAMVERIVLLEERRYLLPQMGMAAHLEIRDKSSMDAHYKFWKNIISAVKQGKGEMYENRNAERSNTSV